MWLIYKLMHEEHALLFSTLLPSGPRACLSSLRRSALLLTRVLPMDSLHNLRRANRHNFLPNPSRNHDQFIKHNSRSLSAHGLHMVSHLDSRHHHFFETLIHFLRMPPPLANCSSLEVMYTAPSLQAMIYMCSQHETSLQHSCEPAEIFPAHVTHIVPCSPALSF